MLLIEQFATVALALANQAHIMEGGTIRYSGTAEELRRDPDLLSAAYLLRGVAAEGGRRVCQRSADVGGRCGGRGHRHPAPP